MSDEEGILMKSRVPMSVLITILAMLLCTASLHAQTTIHVDDDAPNDPGPGDTSISDPLEDGSIDHPFDAIQEAINAAVNGDTVLVADGTYTGAGNQEISFNGKAITVASANGPANCIIDGEGEWGVSEHTAFEFYNGEGPSSVLRGFTITNFLSDSIAGIYCDSSPTIIGNVITGNEGFDMGGAIFVGGSPLIIDNVITDNVGEYSGGIQVNGVASPLIFNCLLTGNLSYNFAYGGAGAIHLWGYYYECEAEIVGCTIVNNTGSSEATGIWANEGAIITVRDSIIWGNASGQIFGYYGSVDWCCVQGGFPGTGIISLNPLFVTGPGGEYYLSQIAAGQASDSPCLDAGSDLAANVCVPAPWTDICMDDSTTRTDGIRDDGQVDMGYHHQAGATVAASIVCVPGSGTLPFQTRIDVELSNLYPDMSRRIAGRINVKLAGGQGYASWRAGYTNVGAGSSYFTSWLQNLPALGTLAGDNVFTLVAEDVTPSPWNLPPYPPSGDTGAAACTVIGVAP